MGSQIATVAFVAPYFAPACYGGVVQVYLGLLRDLDAFRVVVVSDCFATTEEQRNTFDQAAPREFGFEVKRIHSFECHFEHIAPQVVGGWMRGLRLTMAFLNFVRRGRREWREIIAQIRPDVVVCGGTYSAGWLMGDLNGARLVNYLHGEELTMRVHPRVLQPLFRWMQMRALRRAEMNVAVSRYTADIAERLAQVPAERIAVLPNFVDTDRFRVTGRREEFRRQMGWQNRIVLFTLARLEPRKGVDQVLRALALLQERGRLPEDFVYAIAGQGPCRASLQDLARQLGLSGRVEFLGYLKDEDVAPRYEAADVFIQANREVDGDTEGFGIVFLEANACGLPVIGGTAGGTADAIEHGMTGVRVDAENTRAIAEALETLLWDEALRERMGQRGAERVMRCFRAEQAVERFVGLLNAVVDGCSEQVLEDAAPISRALGG